MAYRRLLIGDANVVRFWQAAQVSRPQLNGVSLKAVSCLDTLDSALEGVSNELDYVIVSVVTSFLIEESSQTDISVSSFNVLQNIVKRVMSSAKRAQRVQVRFNQTVFWRFLLFHFSCTIIFYHFLVIAVMSHDCGRPLSSVESSFIETATSYCCSILLHSIF